MVFKPRNAYYLRISDNIVLPLFLYIDERHIDWMSDVVLQHVLANLRQLIIPKLQAEKDVHFGPGAAPGNKRGTVEVHRGGTYQFAYFFRKTEPHSVVLKSKYFVTAPSRPTEVVPRPASPQLAERGPQKRSRNHVSTEQNERKRAKTTRKDKNYLDEEEWSDEETEDDMDDIDPILGEPRPVQEQRRTVTSVHQDEDEDNVKDLYQDVAMNSPPPAGGSSEDPCGQSSSAVVDGGATANCQASISADTPDVELVVEEEERKPKPLLKLNYQSFPISGHCLCVVVEPWPSLRAETRPQFTDLGTSLPPGGSKSSLLPPSGSIVVGQREKTPLFFPEDDRALSEAPLVREKTLPPVPLFHEATKDDYSDDELISFSQTLNAGGHMHAVTADDDDDMDGAILFGDADEIRELF